jgi:hypothetical protein
LKTDSAANELSVVADNVSFVAEEMKYISRFQINIRQRGTNANPWKHQHNFELLTTLVNESRTLVVLKDKNHQTTVFATELPRRLQPDKCSWQMVEEEGSPTIQLRLQYEGDLGDQELGLPECSTMTKEVINELQCGCCDQSLLRNKPIERVLQLPSGHWDEIADYLICYDGVSIDYGWISSSNPCHLLFVMLTD